MTSRTIQQLDAVVTPSPLLDFLPVGQADGTTKRITLASVAQVGLRGAQLVTTVTPTITQGVNLSYSGGFQFYQIGQIAYVIGALTFTSAGTAGQLIAINLPVPNLGDQFGVGNTLSNAGGTYLWTFGRLSGGKYVSQETTALNYYGQAATVAAGHGYNCSFMYLASTPA